MRLGSVIAMRIASAALPCLALAGLIGWTHAPKADTPSAPSPAVESLNFTGLAEISFGETDVPRSQETSTGNRALIGGWVTAPLGDQFGIRLALNGGLEVGSPADVGSNYSIPLLNAGGDIFIRDPSKGYVQLGYRWTEASWRRQEGAWVEDNKLSDHQLRYSVGLFHGDFDLEFGVEYLRRSGRSRVTNLSIGFDENFRASSNGFHVLGGSTWYVADAVALGFGAGWSRMETHVPYPDAHIDRFEARLGVDWQPPVASPRVGTTIGLSTGLGYYTSPFQIVSSENTGGEIIINSITNGEFVNFYYDIRLAVTLYFPGTSSLKERARHYE